MEASAATLARALPASPSAWRRDMARPARLLAGLPDGATTTFGFIFSSVVLIPFSFLSSHLHAHRFFSLGARRAGRPAESRTLSRGVYGLARTLPLRTEKPPFCQAYQGCPIRILLLGAPVFRNPRSG